jgi:hypothetical protein
MTDNGRFDRPPMPLLGNSRLHSQASAKFTGIVRGQGQNEMALSSWTTDEAEIQELELLVFPLTMNEGSGLPANDPQLWGKLRYSLSVSVGPAGAPGLAYTVGLSVPMHGLRYRFRAKSAQLSVRSVTNDQTLALFSAIYPVAGDSTFESCQACQGNTLVTNYRHIPKGARAFRTALHPLETTANVLFGDFDFENTGTVMQTTLATSATDWTPLPPAAVFVLMTSSAPFLDPRFGGFLWFRM